MKKSVIIAIIAVTIVVAIIGVIFVNLNKEKNSITASNFYTIMSQKEYSVQDKWTKYSLYSIFFVLIFINSSRLIKSIYDKIQLNLNI